MLNGAICYDFTTDALPCHLGLVVDLSCLPPGRHSALGDDALLALTDDQILSIQNGYILTYFLGSALVVTDDTYSRLTEGRKLTYRIAHTGWNYGIVTQFL